MKDFYSTDPIWEAIGINSKEQYLERFMVQGKFNQQVHEHVRDAYVTVEYLIAHAYYHYPMFDEALKKGLGIVEMAVKLRCSELNISLTNANSKDKTLANLIIELDECEPGKNLGTLLGYLRKIRNHYAHPHYHSFMGMLTRLNIVTVVNMLNTIFLEESLVVGEDQRLDGFKIANDDLKDGLFIFGSGEDPGILITAAEPICIGSNCHSNISLWKLYPVLSNFTERFSEFSFDLPIIVILKDVYRNNGALEAISPKTLKKITITSTAKPENRQMLETFKTDYDRLDENVKSVYEMALRTSGGSESVQFTFDYVGPA